MFRIDVMRPFFQVSLWLALALFVADNGLHVLANTPVLGWLPRAVAGTGFIEDNRQRVEGAMRYYRDGLVSPDDHLCVIVGISNVREGIDLDTVTAAVGKGWHFLGAAGAGLGIGDVARNGDVVLSSSLRPDLVVLGISLHQLLDSRPKPGHQLHLGVLDYLRRGDLRNALIAVRDASWSYSRRQDASLAVSGGLLDAREKLFRAMGVTLESGEAARRSPWREMIKSDWPDHFSAATLREEEVFFEGLGAFDPTSYEQSPRALGTLVELIRRFQEDGSPVIVMLMPDHPTLSRRIPVEALGALRRRLTQSLSASAPAVLDFRNTVDETGFVDLSHLNQTGRRAFSAVFARQLRDELPTRPSLMRQVVKR
jgi:hypothetical protein